MVKEGEQLAALHPQIVVKIPMVKDGIKALKYFSDRKIKTNCTLIFSAGQAFWLPKREQPMSLHLLDDWMMCQPMELF